MSKFKKIIYILLIMVIYLILIFIQITPKISFKGQVMGIPVKERVYIYPDKNISISKIDDRYTGIISPSVVVLSPGTHEIKAEYKRGRVKGEYYFEPYNYPPGTKVIVTATEKRGVRNNLAFDLKLGEEKADNSPNILEYIFYTISTLIASITVFVLTKELKIVRRYERRARIKEGAFLKTAENLYLYKINGKRINIKSMRIPEGKYFFDIIYKKKNEKSFFGRITFIQFDNVEIEIMDRDILEIGYLIENKKIRLDFNLKQEKK
ncbi:hypothetical protein [Sebaldella sp. S0638]|uniref:hypothetical protein n=1 Tax=Sebaldella sp. S0638 TaxID=2957809 RepID=UPI0020A0F4DA|nr:hypothetical protein [Sebaldella sp. S0638]MCP1223254.1 hypothetical protein [Sebaldella sp. S0638]